jgi:hypothetical protein
VNIKTRRWFLRLPFRWRIVVKTEAWRQPREADLPTVEDIQGILAAENPHDA